AEVLGEWVELSFPREGSEDSDTFRFRVLSPTRAEMIYAGTRLPPYTLQRVGDGALLGPFDEVKTYGAPRNSAATSCGARPEPALSRLQAAPRSAPAGPWPGAASSRQTAPWARRPKESRPLRPRWSPPGRFRECRANTLRPSRQSRCGALRRCPCAALFRW